MRDIPADNRHHIGRARQVRPRLSPAQARAAEVLAKEIPTPNDGIFRRRGNTIQDVVNRAMAELWARLHPGEPYPE